MRGFTRNARLAQSLHCPAESVKRESPASIESRSREDETESDIGSSIAPLRPKAWPGGPTIRVLWRPTFDSRRTISIEKSLPSRGEKKGSDE